jgi:hypothetical protein
MTPNTYQFSIKTKNTFLKWKVLSDRRTLVETFYDNDSAEIERFTISNKKETTY